tara:strand:+ start:1712 stop:2614 length:903 start_codon:yes stop_codon:yes gene_type:complete
LVALDPAYRGRFAPSPTGPLHYGSLYTAIASFLQARSKGGKWLVRIDDLDSARCQQQYSSKILKTLEQFGLTWDEPVFYQHTRHHDYQQALEQLLERQLLYPCQCSRKDLANRGLHAGLYDGHCLSHPLKPNQPSALRIRLANKKISFIDAVQGPSHHKLQTQHDDFVMFRKDRVYSYHLAVVIDDNTQGITEVLRGHDLLDSTYQQIHLQQLLNIQTPHYAHIPVITDTSGIKLSKQTYASDISLSPVKPTLLRTFVHLSLNPPQELLESSTADILNWGIKHWSLKQIIAQQSLPLQSN